MVSKYKSLLITIPAYNEERTIDKTALMILSELDKIALKSRLLIVNDGSNDKTSEIIIKIKNKKPEKIDIINHKKNSGYGTAIQNGIKYAIKNRFDFVLFMDSDLTNSPADIKRFSELTKGDYDCVKASRYIKDGKIENVPLKRIIISRIGNLIASYAFNVGVKDCTNGFQMIKAEKFKNTSLKEKDFSIIMELMYVLKKKKGNFIELPVTLANRKSGKSSFRYTPYIIYRYLKYPIKSLWI